MEYIGPLFKLVLLSILIERFLAVFFDLTGVKEKLQVEIKSATLPSGQPRKFSGKGLIAGFIGVVFCLSTDFEVVNSILLVKVGAPLDLPPPVALDANLAEIITGIIIAGGSQGSVKLFQDILGFSKENRDLIRQTSQKQQEAAQIRADAEKKAAEVEQLKQANTLKRLTGGGASTIAGGRAVFDSETEALMTQVIPNAEERSVLRHVVARLGRRGGG